LTQTVYMEIFNYPSFGQNPMETCFSTAGRSWEYISKNILSFNPSFFERAISLEKSGFKIFKVLFRAH